MELQNRKNLQFRVSTALKSIIGKDLINDKFRKRQILRLPLNLTPLL